MLPAVKLIKRERHREREREERRGEERRGEERRGEEKRGEERRRERERGEREREEKGEKGRERERKGEKGREREREREKETECHSQNLTHSYNKYDNSDAFLMNLHYYCNITFCCWSAISWHGLGAPWKFTASPRRRAKRRFSCSQIQVSAWPEEVVVENNWKNWGLQPNDWKLLPKSYG